MNLSKFLNQLDFSPEKKDIDYLKKENSNLVEEIKKEIKKERVDADVFVGGSLAKGTLVKGEEYDIDIFVRFNWKYEDISKRLEKIIKNISKKLNLKIERVHGSRDYFRLFKEKKYIFEIIPVSRIKNPKEARNVTDLSYFHVNYVKRRIKGKLAKEVLIAKKFCEAQNVYGAESYIQGFSGYGLECLIIHYKSFEKLAKEISKVKERVIIDTEKKFKKKEDVLFELNESKIQSPIVLVDPTWKERNVLAALSRETFEKFQKAIREFLKKPGEKFFEISQFNEGTFEKEAIKNKAEIVKVSIETERQKGDIAGTKMKKFSKFLEREISKNYKIIKSEFIYSGKQDSQVYIIAKNKGVIERIGPPAGLKKHALAFKKANKKVVERKGILYAIINTNISLKDFAKKWIKDNSRKIKEMDVRNVRI